LCFARDGRRGRIVDVRIEHDPWTATTEPLPESFYGLDALKRLRPIVYAVMHAFAWSLEAEIDPCIALIERRSHG
jgi:hypothetical protein